MQKVENQQSNEASPPPPPPPLTPPSTPSRLDKKNESDSPRRPITPRTPSFRRAQTSKSESVRVQTQNIDTKNVVNLDEDTGSPMERHLHDARLKLRRFKASD